jgi:hypothetical protein
MLLKYKNSKVEKTCHIVFFLCGWRDEWTGVQCFSYIVDFEIFRTIVNFIKISSGHSLIIKLIFIKFFRTISVTDGQMS